MMQRRAGSVCNRAGGIRLSPRIFVALACCGSCLFALQAYDVPVCIFPQYMSEAKGIWVFAYRSEVALLKVTKGYVD